MESFPAYHRDDIAAMDYFSVPTITFSILYILVVIDHARRRIIHFNVTRTPGSTWVAQQQGEAFPFDQAPQYLIYDNDAKSPRPSIASSNPSERRRSELRSKVRCRMDFASDGWIPSAESCWTIRLARVPRRNGVGAG